ncbi:hypothetical protein JX266_006514 [Neoarthrinium moseri]|nr:hypothetical protein JX266_006514 [Neoarthrinium moseri]
MDPDTMSADSTPDVPQTPQFALLDFFFPGFSMFASAVHKYAHIDLNLYIPLVMLFGALTLVWNYSSQYFWDQVESHFMSSVDIRIDDEIYNILMTWVANQRFAQGARRFVVNTNINSRSWYLWRWDYDEENEDGSDTTGQGNESKKKALSYTPSFGTHYFWYRGRFLLFKRNSKESSSSFMAVSEREEISVCCFGRNPWILKELLHEARSLYMEKDQQKTLIYRGTTRSGSTEPTWQRCLARATRPFSTVILNKKTKQDLIDDVTDYLHPATQRWYSNRGIPYRRGYLLYGPPGTGKSSLSLALAGFFKMRIYIVSLSSITASEENLATLFAELPRRCVVLLEDIDTAGLTHTREQDKDGSESSVAPAPLEPGQLTPGNGNTNKNEPVGRLSLSGLLNILDGVASQEGRVLIMTTNHLEKLDKALIRPGRVDMIVEFGHADTDMTASIFRAIFAHIEGDDDAAATPNAKELLDDETLKKEAVEKERRQKEDDARVEALAVEFAAKIPAHEFSPAELQGHLLRHKRDPRAAIDKADEFVEQTRKDRKEKEIKAAEEKRLAEEKRKEEEAKQKEEEDKKKKEEDEAKLKEEREKAKTEKKERKRKAKREERKKKRDESKRSSSGSGSDASSDSSSDESEAEDAQKKSAATKKPVEVPDVKPAKSKHEKKDSGYGTPTSVEA